MLTDDDRDNLRDWWDEDTTASVESSFPIIARIITRERAAALREAADEWTQGAWFDELTAVPLDRRIGAAQRMGDWLRDRADHEETR